MTIRRLTWLDPQGVRHLVSTQRPGCVCGVAPTDMTNTHDEIIYTGVDEGDHPVTCVTCMSGEEADDDKLLEALRKSLGANTVGVAVVNPAAVTKISFDKE